MGTLSLVAEHTASALPKGGHLMDTDNKTFSPPYNIPFATFLNTAEKVAADLPNRVDRSYLGSASGSIKSYLIGAFRGFGLVDDDLKPTATMKTFAENPDGRKGLIGELVHEHYPLAVKLGETNATPDELDKAFAEMFPSVTGESRTKAVRFYLSACDYAGIPKSPLWKSPKAGTGPKRGRRPKNPPAGDAAGGTSGPAITPKIGHSLREFTLPSGTVLTLSIDRDVLALDRPERKFVMEVIDKIEEYEEKHPFAPPPPPPASVNGSSTATDAAVVDHVEEENPA